MNSTSKRNIQLFLLIAFLVCVSSRKVSYAGAQLWRVTPEDQNQINFLLNLSKGINRVQYWKSPTQLHKDVDFLVLRNEIGATLRQLRSKGIKHTILSQNVQDLIDHERVNMQRSVVLELPNIQDFNYLVYHQAEEIEEWMTIAERDNSYVSKFQVGVTYEGRPINALKFSANSNSSKPAIYIDSMIHSREWITTASLLHIMKEMLTNPSYAWMVEDLDWYIIPLINVDGYIYTWTTDRLWRRTRSDQASLRCKGVDLNRNFDDHWKGPLGSSSEPCADTYRGPIPESEAETRHIARFIASNNDSIKAVVTLHSYAQLVMYPYNFEEGVYPANTVEQDTIAAAVSEAMFYVHNTTYNYGPAAETLRPATGVTTDWTQAKASIDINFTIELRDTGKYGFVLPEDQIIPTSEELMAGLIKLAEYVRDR